MAWDDEPPTEAELKRVSTPRWDDEPPPPDVSAVESGIRGAAQGLSFGLADEATGAAEAAKDWLMNDPKGFMDNYKKHRDESRKNYKSAEEANPGTYMAGQFGGGAGTALLSGGTGLGALAAQGALQGLGSSEADLTEGNYKGAIGDTVIGGSIGAIGEGVGRLGGKALGAVANKTGLNKVPSWIADKLGDTAENLAVKATGATGREAEKFADDAGRQLLDRGAVRFFDSPTNIAGRLEKMVKAGNQDIDDALRTLDAQGVTASAENVIGTLQDKIASLRRDPSQAGLVKKLEGVIDNIVDTGESSVPISLGEQTKRGFRKAAGNWMDPDAGQAGKNAYLAYMDEVEQAATKANPDLAKKFIEGKETYGLLNPIKEAAERRSSQLSQSPIGGLLDVATTATTGSPVTGIATAVGRRILSPRIASSGAIIADNLADVVRNTPQALGKFAKPLADAAARGGNALAANHFVLLQTNPEYRDLVMKAEEDSKMAQQIRYRVPTKE